MDLPELRGGDRAIAVVIPHLNQPEFLRRCLAALAKGTRAADEIVVIDNGSDRPPETICASYPGVRLVVETTPGPGPARNRGIAETAAPRLAFIDADCLADPHWLETVAKSLDAPDSAVIGGDVRIALANPGKITMIEAYESEYAYRMDRYIAREGFTGTGNLAMHRHVYDAVGPFGGLDVAEDRDWGQRATARGFSLRYVAEMRVFHPARADFSELAAKWDRHTAHDYALYRKRRWGRALWVARTMAMALSPPAELPRILASRRLSGPRARLLAAVGLARIRQYRARAMLALVFSDDPDALSKRWNR